MAECRKMTDKEHEAMQKIMPEMNSLLSKLVATMAAVGLRDAGMDECDAFAYVSHWLVAHAIGVMCAAAELPRDSLSEETLLHMSDTIDEALARMVSDEVRKHDNKHYGEMN